MLYTAYQAQSDLTAGAGHFGVFSGARWEREVYPEIRSHILMAG
jgi:poly-beta-hydroxyalkanoate depolymerase